MLITENKLRQIIREVIKEGLIQEKSEPLNENFKKLAGTILMAFGLSLTPMNVNKVGRALKSGNIDQEIERLSGGEYETLRDFQNDLESGKLVDDEIAQLSGGQFKSVDDYKQKQKTQFNNLKDAIRMFMSKNQDLDSEKLRKETRRAPEVEDAIEDLRSQGVDDAEIEFEFIRCYNDFDNFYNRPSIKRGQ